MQERGYGKAQKGSPAPRKEHEAAAAHESAVRTKCATLMHLLLGKEPQVHYPPGDVRTRTIHQIATLAQLEQELLAGRLTIDCSQSVTLIAHVAGAKDPNGGNYSSDGYTGTLLQGSQRITTRQARVGDLRVYGPGTGHHVCMCLTPGNDPLMFSHGQEKGPIAIRDSIEARYQPAGGAWLRLPI